MRADVIEQDSINKVHVVTMQRSIQPRGRNVLSVGPPQTIYWDDIEIRFEEKATILCFPAFPVVFPERQVKYSTPLILVNSALAMWAQTIQFIHIISHLSLNNIIASD